MTLVISFLFIYNKKGVQSMKEIPMPRGSSEHLQQYGLSTCECRALAFQRGEVIISQGMAVESLYFVISGQVEARILYPDGRQLALCYTPQDGVLGDVELMGEYGAASATVSAMTEVVCLAFPYAKAREQYRCNLTFLRQIARDLNSKLRRNTQRLVSASLAPAHVRIGRFVLHSAAHGRYCGTMTQISEATGISYRHMLRVMASFCRDGILKKTPQGYLLTDLAALQELCQ